jgi:streptogramin lyase
MRQLVALPLLALSLAVPTSAHAYEARHVFITNRGGGNIVELDASFGYQRTWFEGMPFEGAELSSPNGMAFTPDGALFVADTQNQRIVAFDAGGTFVRAFSTTARLSVAVESIYFDGAGVMFATANPGSGVVARFDRTGANLADVVNAPAFLNLGNVNLTEAGNVLVSDFSGMNRGLRELDPATGSVVRTFGSALGRQEDVMVDGGDRVFVSHFAGNEIVVFGPAPTRTELYRFTAPASAGVALTSPTGIALTYDCHILVASFDSNAIFIFRHEGASAPTFERVLRAGMEIPADAMLSNIESIAIAGLGLPGSFDEFADRVPSCDEPVIPDAGPPPDAAAISADASLGVDAEMRPRDAGRSGPAPTSTSSCGCHAAGSGPTPRWLGSFAAGLALVTALRRRLQNAEDGRIGRA